MRTELRDIGWDSMGWVHLAQDRYLWDRLCGLLVRVPGYRSRGLGSISGATRFPKKQYTLERGPLSLVSTTEELLERKSNGSGLETRDYGRRDPMR
jgi:hypothetical protein